MKEDNRSKEYTILIAVFLLCIESCSAQCGNAAGTKGTVSMLCSATNFTIDVELPAHVTNPDLRNLRVTCRSDTHEKEVDLRGTAHSPVQRIHSWTGTLPYLIDDSNIMCVATGCYSVAEGSYNLPTSSCSVEVEIVFLSNDTSLSVGETALLACVGYGEPDVGITWSLNGDTISNSSLITIYEEDLVQGEKLHKQSFLQLSNLAVLDAGVYICLVSNGLTTVNATTQLTVTMLDLTVATTTPSMMDTTVDGENEDFSTLDTSAMLTPTYASTTTAFGLQRGHYYITLLAFPLMLLIIFILGAMSCIIKQRIDLKRKKEIQFGNWIENDNLHYNATPISIQQAVIRYSESSSTLYSGLLYPNTCLVEAPSSLANPAKVHYNLVSKGCSEYSSKPDESLQPTLTAESGDDTSKCSVYKNTMEILDDSQWDGISPGYTREFPDFLVFEESREDDQYVVQNMGQDDAEILSLVQTDDGIPSAHGNELPSFPPTSDGYIKN